MKLNEMNEEIAAACDMRAKSVAMVQKETFRRLREAVEKGERVLIPGFGIFSTKEKPASEGVEASKVVRFRILAREEQPAVASPEERKAKKQAKKTKKAAATEEEPNGVTADAGASASDKPQ
jgi:nucleoid DNA-binding protein